MSGALDALKFLVAGTHFGGTDFQFQMEQHIYKRKSVGIYIINLKSAWGRLMLAARAVVAIENPADVSQHHLLREHWPASPAEALPLDTPIAAASHPAPSLTRSK